MDRHKINTIAVYGSHATMRLTDDVAALLTALAEHGVDLYIETPLWEALSQAGIPKGYPQMRLGDTLWRHSAEPRRRWHVAAGCTQATRRGAAYMGDQLWAPRLHD